PGGVRRRGVTAMQFVKMHGTGNDFVMIDARNWDADWESLARKMCDRHFGVGSDGIILALPADSADLRMRMFNPDGSEAEMCGNARRARGGFVAESGIARSKDGALMIGPLGGLLRCELIGAEGAVERVRVSMGRPHLAPEEVPVLAESSGPVLH